jgi:hypothetical protein
VNSCRFRSIPVDSGPIPVDSGPIPVDSGEFLQEWEGHCKVLPIGVALWYIGKVDHLYFLASIVYLLNALCNY